jgi:hypothetical protein
LEVVDASFGIVLPGRARKREPGTQAAMKVGEVVRMGGSGASRRPATTTSMKSRDDRTPRAKAAGAKGQVRAAPL